MTKQKNLKQLIRARMQATGESYSTARRILLADRETDAAADALVLALCQPPARSGDMYKDIESLFVDGYPLDCDVVVLPELIGANSNPDEYEAHIAHLAREMNTTVVGGSCYRQRGSEIINSGIVVDPDGLVLSRYDKVRPYGSELNTGVGQGDSIGEFEVAGRRFSVLICSDLWFSDSFNMIRNSPDVVLIPSFSITQRSNPSKAKQLWQHMLVSRSYEYSAYIGVSDWMHGCEFDGLLAAGVTGLSNPRPEDDDFYVPLVNGAWQKFHLDFERLDRFKDNRASRGFLAGR